MRKYQHGRSQQTSHTGSRGNAPGAGCGAAEAPASISMINSGQKNCIFLSGLGKLKARQGAHRKYADALLNALGKRIGCDALSRFIFAPPRWADKSPFLRGKSHSVRRSSFRLKGCPLLRKRLISPLKITAGTAIAVPAHDMFFYRPASRSRH